MNKSIINPLNLVKHLSSIKSLHHVKLYGLLSASTLLVWRASKKSARLNQLLRDKPFVFQLQTADGAAAYMELLNNHLKIKLGLHPAPDFIQYWQHSSQAVDVLLSRDETDVLRAFEDGRCDMQGNFLIAMWFNEAMKIARRF